MRCNHVGEPASIADPFERRLDLRLTRIAIAESQKSNPTRNKNKKFIAV